MSKHLVNSLKEKFIGRRIELCIDEITTLAKGKLINVMDPSFNKIEIDNDDNRLNVKTDIAGKIVDFTIG